MISFTRSDERTTDIYEQIAAYPRPPLVSLPEPDDLSSLEPLGLKLTRSSRWIVKAAMSVAGFGVFREQLPQTIEELLRRHELRGSYLFAPVISATLALKDDPRGFDPIERAATLLFAARSFYQDVISGRLVPDRYQGQVLEMGQYPNFFSTSLTVDGGGARMFKSPDTAHIIVAVARRLYRLWIGSPGSETTIEQLRDALEDLARMAHQDRLRIDELCPGILTCADHATQIGAFRALQRNDTNARSLVALRNSFLTLCLDLDSYPSSYAEAAFTGQSENCANRWHHASLQFVVFGNAKACAICNFSAYLDGNTMMRGVSEMQRRAAECPTGSRPTQELAPLPPAVELRWEFDAKLVQQAHRDLRSVQDGQRATFEIQGFGTDFFDAQKLKSVPTFVLALQMTAKRLIGRTVDVTQFLTMSRYRCMDLVTANVTTPEVIRFVEWMDHARYGQARALMNRALDSQAEQCRKARQYLPLGEILSLFALSRTGLQRVSTSVVGVSAVMLLRALGLFKPYKREIVISHPDIYPEVPVVGRPGVRLPYVRYFGLHYQIMKDRTVLTVMPSTEWIIPNAELVAELQASLGRIQQLVMSPPQDRAEPAGATSRVTG